MPMIAYAFWSLLLAAVWYWATFPARRTHQDRRDHANIARSKSPRSLP